MFFFGKFVHSFGGVDGVAAVGCMFVSHSTGSVVQLGASRSATRDTRLILVSLSGVVGEHGGTCLCVSIDDASACAFPPQSRGGCATCRAFSGCLGSSVFAGVGVVDI